MALISIDYGNSDVSGASKSKLLWTNPDASSAFDAQTISLDLSSYDAVLVECRFSTNTSTQVSRTYMKKGDSTQYTRIYVSTYYRETTVSDSGLVIGSTSSGGSTVCIPTRIYGITRDLIDIAT